MRKFASFVGSEGLPILVDPVGVACLSGMYLNGDEKRPMTLMILSNGCGAIPVEGTPEEVHVALTEATRLN